MATLSAPPADPRTDLALVTAHQAGDPAAFPALLGRHQPMMLRVAHRFVRDPQRAEDAAQDAALAAWRAIDTCRFAHPAQLETWLYRCARSAAVDTWRAEQSRPQQAAALLEEHHGTPVADHADAVTERMTLEITVRTAMAGLLIEAQRDAVTRVDLLGQSVAEVAADTGVGLATVRTRLHRGRRKLRALLSTAPA